MAEHPDDAHVQTAYLGLVGRKGTPEQTERVLEETSEWLAEHPDDANVRTAYLALVERKGTPEQTERALGETSKWLREHPRATVVWDRFISYLCTMQRYDDAKLLTQEAVRLHPGNRNLVLRYLSLMHDRLDEPRIRDLYASLIKSYPRDPAIKQSWARWLQSHGDTKEAEKVFKELTEKHPRSYHHWYGYGRLLLDVERYDEAKDKFRQVLNIHRGHTMAHDGLAQVLWGLARRAEESADHSGAERLFTKAEREFKSAIHWAGINQYRQAIFYNHLGRFYIDRKRWDDALGAFKQATSEDPEYFGNHWGQGRAFVGLEQWRKAAHALRTAMEKAPDTLGPPASDDIRQLLERTEAELAKESQQSQVDVD